jgi:exodeoxyribonuclease VII small subunit
LPVQKANWGKNPGWAAGPDYNLGFAYFSAMAKTPAAPLPAPSYEAALTDLERLVAAMEGGQLPLDTLLTNYQRGSELLAFCRDRLQAVETQVQQLENGQLKPWGGAP